MMSAILGCKFFGYFKSSDFYTVVSRSRLPAKRYIWFLNQQPKQELPLIIGVFRCNSIKGVEELPLRVHVTPFVTLPLVKLFRGKIPTWDAG